MSLLGASDAKSDFNSPTLLLDTVLQMLVKSKCHIPSKSGVNKPSVHTSQSKSYVPSISGLGKRTGGTECFPVRFSCAYLLIQKLADYLERSREAAKTLSQTLSDRATCEKVDFRVFQQLTGLISEDKGAHTLFEKIVHETRVSGNKALLIQLSEYILSLQENAVATVQAIHSLMVLQAKAMFSAPEEKGVPSMKNHTTLLSTVVCQALAFDNNDEEIDGKEIPFYTEFQGVTNETVPLIKNVPEMLNNHWALIEERIHNTLQKVSENLTAHGQEYQDLVQNIATFEKTSSYASFLNVVDKSILLNLGIKFSKLLLLEETVRELMQVFSVPMKDEDLLLYLKRKFHRNTPPKESPGKRRSQETKSSIRTNFENNYEVFSNYRLMEDYETHPGRHSDGNIVSPSHVYLSCHGESSAKQTVKEQSTSLSQSRALVSTYCEDGPVIEDSSILEEHPTTTTTESFEKGSQTEIINGEYLPQELSVEMHNSPLHSEATLELKDEISNLSIAEDLVVTLEFAEAIIPSCQEFNPEAACSTRSQSAEDCLHNLLTTKKITGVGSLDPLLPEEIGAVQPPLISSNLLMKTLHTAKSLARKKSSGSQPHLLLPGMHFQPSYELTSLSYPISPEVNSSFRLPSETISLFQLSLEANDPLEACDSSQTPSCEASEHPASSDEESNQPSCHETLSPLPLLLSEKTIEPLQPQSFKKEFHLSCLKSESKACFFPQLPFLIFDEINDKLPSLDQEYVRPSLSASTSSQPPSSDIASKQLPPDEPPSLSLLLLPCDHEPGNCSLQSEEEDKSLHSNSFKGLPHLKIVAETSCGVLQQPSLPATHPLFNEVNHILPFNETIDQPTSGKTSGQLPLSDKFSDKLPISQYFSPDKAICSSHLLLSEIDCSFQPQLLTDLFCIDEIACDSPPQAPSYDVSDQLPPYIQHSTDEVCGQPQQSDYSPSSDEENDQSPLSAKASGQLMCNSLPLLILCCDYEQRNDLPQLLFSEETDGSLELQSSKSLLYLNSITNVVYGTPRLQSFNKANDQLFSSDKVLSGEAIVQPPSSDKRGNRLPSDEANCCLPSDEAGDQLSYAKVGDHLPLDIASYCPLSSDEVSDWLSTSDEETTLSDEAGKPITNETSNPPQLLFSDKAICLPLMLLSKDVDGLLQPQLSRRVTYLLHQKSITEIACVSIRSLSSDEPTDQPPTDKPTDQLPSIEAGDQLLTVEADDHQPLFDELSDQHPFDKTNYYWPSSDKTSYHSPYYNEVRDWLSTSDEASGQITLPDEACNQLPIPNETSNPPQLLFLDKAICLPLMLLSEEIGCLLQPQLSRKLICLPHQKSIAEITWGSIQSPSPNEPTDQPPTNKPAGHDVTSSQPPTDEADKQSPTNETGGQSPTDQTGGQPPPAGKGGQPPPDQKGDQPPLDEKGDQPPSDEKSDQPPPDEKGNHPPPAEKGDQPPPDEKGDQPPSDEKSDQPPPDEKGDQSPSDEKGDQLPPDKNSDQPPPDEKSDQSPSDEKGDQPPSDEKGDQLPPDKNSDQPPPDKKSDQSPSDEKSDLPLPAERGDQPPHDEKGDQTSLDEIGDQISFRGASCWLLFGKEKNQTPYFNERSDQPPAYDETSYLLLSKEATCLCQPHECSFQSFEKVTALFHINFMLIAEIVDGPTPLHVDDENSFPVASSVYKDILVSLLQENLESSLKPAKEAKENGNKLTGIISNSPTIIKLEELCLLLIEEIRNLKYIIHLILGLCDSYTLSHSRLQHFTFYKAYNLKLCHRSPSPNFCPYEWFSGDQLLMLLSNCLQNVTVILLESKTKTLSSYNYKAKIDGLINSLKESLYPVLVKQLCILPGCNFHPFMRSYDVGSLCFQPDTDLQNMNNCRESLLSSSEQETQKSTINNKEASNAVNCRQKVKMKKVGQVPLSKQLYKLKQPHGPKSDFIETMYAENKCSHKSNTCKQNVSQNCSGLQTPSKQARQRAALRRQQNSQAHFGGCVELRAEENSSHEYLSCSQNEFNCHQCATLREKTRRQVFNVGSRVGVTYSIQLPISLSLKNKFADGLTLAEITWLHTFPTATVFIQVSDNRETVVMQLIEQPAVHGDELCSNNHCGIHQVDISVPKASLDRGKKGIGKSVKKVATRLCVAESSTDHTNSKMVNASCFLDQLVCISNDLKTHNSELARLSSHGLSSELSSLVASGGQKPTFSQSKASNDPYHALTLTDSALNGRSAEVSSLKLHSEGPRNNSQPAIKVKADGAEPEIFVSERRPAETSNSNSKLIPKSNRKSASRIQTDGEEKISERDYPSDRQRYAKVSNPKVLAKGPGINRLSTIQVQIDSTDGTSEKDSDTRDAEASIVNLTKGNRQSANKVQGDGRSQLHNEKSYKTSSLSHNYQLVSNNVETAREIDFEAQHSLSRRPDWISAVTELLHVPDYSKMIQRLNSETPTTEHFVSHRFIRGIAYFKIGKFQQAMRDLLEGERCAQETDQRGGVSLCNVYLGDLYYSSGSYLEAAKCYQKAAEYYESDNIAKLFRMVAPTVSAIRTKCGSCFRTLSKSVEAIQEYKKAIEASTKDKDRLTVHTSLGNLYQSSGQNNEALKEYEQALELAQKLKDHISFAWTHGNLGNAYLGLSKKDKALFHLQKALDLTVKYEPTPSAIGRAYNNIGTAYQSMGDLDKAEEHYDLALSQAIYGNDPAGQARVYGNIGNIFIVRKMFEKAIPHYSEVLRLSTDEATVTTALHNRGCAYYEWAESKMIALEKSSAERNLSNGHIIFRIHGSKTVSHEHSPRIVIDSVYKLYKQGKDDLEKVLASHEKKLDHIKGSAKGLSLTVSLFESNSRTFHRLQDCMVNLGNWREALLFAEQSKARTLGEMMLARKGSQLDYPLTSPLNLKQVYAAVSSQSSPVLYLSHTGASILGWVLIPLEDSSSIFMEMFEVPLKDDQFDGKSFDYHTRYSLTEILVEQSYEMYCSVEYSEEYTAPAVTLYELIGRPLQAILKKAKKLSTPQKIVLVTDTYTALLPFACFYDPESKTFLGDCFYFEIGFSFLTMGIMNQLPEPIVELPADPQNMCIIGNPTIPQFYHSNEVWSLGKLPYAKREAQWVGHILGTPPILDEQATKSAILMRFMRAKLIHIATHGSSVSGFLAFSALTSTRQGEVVDSSSVLLHPEEVEKLSISPALVVLSSCDSARGTVKADGIQGMARAFLLAGM